MCGFTKDLVLATANGAELSLPIAIDSFCSELGKLIRSIDYWWGNN